MYGTKNIVKTMFGCWPTRPKSLGKLIVSALEMLTLEYDKQIRSLVSNASLECLPVEKGGDVDDEEHRHHSQIYSTQKPSFIDVCFGYSHRLHF